MLVPSSPARPKSAAARSPRPPAAARAAARRASPRATGPRKRRLASRYASGVPKSRISACAISRGLRADDQRVGHDRARQLVQQLARRTRRKIAATGSTRKASATAAARQHEAAQERAARFTLDARQEAVAQQDPLAGRAEHALDEGVPGARSWLAETTQIPYCTFGWPTPGSQRLHLPRHRPRVGRVDEARVGLVQRDLRQHLAHVGLAADDVVSTRDRFMFFSTCSV